MSSQDTEHRQNERSMRRSTSAIAWLTAVLAAVGGMSAVFSALQGTAIKSQLDEMRAEQRPWLSIVGDKSKITSPLISEANGLHYDVEITGRNNGRLPALNAMVEHYIVLSDGFIDISRAFIRKEQERNIMSVDLFTSQNILPGE